jgi:superkiller protein 3
MRKLAAVATIAIVLLTAPRGWADPRATAQAQYDRGLALKQAGKTAEALAEFQASTRSDPTFTQAHFSLGLLLKRSGDLEAAQKSFEAAIKTAADHGPSQLALAQLLLQQGEFAAARSRFALAVRGKGMESADLAEAWNGTGISFRYEARFADAIKAFDAAIQHGPGNWTYQVNKGIAANRSKDKKHLPVAEAAYRKATELAPDRAETWAGLGVSLRLQGNIEAAIAAYEQAVERNPRDADSWNDLAAMYMKHKAYDKAITALDAYLRLAKPGSAAAQAAEKQAAELRAKTQK